MHTVRRIADLGGKIANPLQGVPGEIRGTGVSGPRTHEIVRGDIVLITCHTAHSIVSTAEKLGKDLVIVWV